MAISDANWPKRPDGTRMTLGEMTKEQQAEVVKGACERLQADFDKPEVKKHLSKLLADGPKVGKRRVAALLRFPIGVDKSKVIRLMEKLAESGLIESTEVEVHEYNPDHGSPVFYIP